MAISHENSSSIVPRSEFLNDIAGQVCTEGGLGVPVLLSGGPGWGKTHFLKSLNREVTGRKQFLTLFFPFDEICFSPDFFIEKCRQIISDAVDRAGERFSGFRKKHSGTAVDDLFGMIESAGKKCGFPPLITVDEVAEIAVLKSFPGQGDPLRRFLELSRAYKVVMSSAFPSRVIEAAGRAEILLEHYTVPAMERLDVEETAAGLSVSLNAGQFDNVSRICCGSPAYLGALLKKMKTSGSKNPVDAALEELSPGGGLELLCRFSYEYLVQRSRGQGIVRQLLAVIASMQIRSGRINLTSIAAELDRSLGVTKDYIKWLLAVDIIESREKEYRIKDDLLAAWIRLFKSGCEPSASDIEREIKSLAAQVISSPAPPVKAKARLRVKKKTVADKPEVPRDSISRKIGHDTVTYVVHRPQRGSGLEEID